jgi:ABC-type transporter Mla MlaB component
LDSTDHLPLAPLQGARPAPEPSAAILELRGAIVRSDVPALCGRVRALVEEGQANLVVCDVAGVSDPDCATVDALARMQLTAKRLGSGLRLRGASDELHELLAMAGLCEVVGLCGGYASS